MLNRVDAGESAATFFAPQSPKLRAILANAASSTSVQFQETLKTSTDSGALGSSKAGSEPAASGDRNQYRVTMPKLPPPPPVCAHQRSWLGSDASRVATTLLAVPLSSTTTTSTP